MLVKKRRQSKQTILTKTQLTGRKDRILTKGDEQEIKLLLLLLCVCGKHKGFTLDTHDSMEKSQCPNKVCHAADKTHM